MTPTKGTMERIDVSQAEISGGAMARIKNRL